MVAWPYGMGLAISLLAHFQRQARNLSLSVSSRWDKWRVFLQCSTRFSRVGTKNTPTEFTDVVMVADSIEQLPVYRLANTESYSPLREPSKNGTVIVNK